MKRKDLLLLTFLLSQTMPVWAMEPAEERQQGAIIPRVISSEESIRRALRLQHSLQAMTTKIKEAAAQYPDAVGSVVVLGKIGSGKSTLITGIASTLKAEEVPDGKLGINTDQPLPGINIHRGITAGTLIPSAWYDRDNKIIYWDCPGFEAPSGADDQMINGLALEEVFKNPNVKVVLVVPDRVLNIDNDRGSHFFQLLNETTKLFPDQVQLQNVLSFIITKGGQLRRHQPQNRLRTLQLEVNASDARNFSPNTSNASQGEIRSVNNQLDLSQNARLLLDFLVTNNSHIASFPKPMTEGAYQFDKTKILDCIMNNTQYVENLTIDLRAGMGDKAKRQAIEYSQALNDYLTNYMKTEAPQQVINSCLMLIDEHQESAKTLRKTFDAWLLKLSSLQNVSRETPMDFVSCLNNIFNSNNRTLFIVDEIRKAIESITFFKKIDNGVAFDVAEWAKAFVNSIVGKLKKLATPPKTVDDRHGTLNIEGLLVGVKDINKVLRSHPNTTSVHAYSLNTLFIDRNIIAPSISVSFISPCVKLVQGPKIINLSGRSGANGAHGIPGTGDAGKAGEPGENSGHFFAKSVVFKNLNQLTLQASGGNGGHGGNGANGVDGENGGDGDLTVVTKTQDYHKVHWQPGRTDHIDDYGTRNFYQDRGVDGESGGNGGQGGQGASGGYPGIVLIDGHDWNHVPQNGKNGTNGSAGQGGQGGRHGKHCTGRIVTNIQTITRNNDTGAEQTALSTGFVEVPQVHLLRNPSHALNGKPGVGLNREGPQALEVQQPFNVQGILEGYHDFYLQEIVDEATQPFVKLMPANAIGAEIADYQDEIRRQSNVAATDRSNSADQEAGAERVRALQEQGAFRQAEEAAEIHEAQTAAERDRAIAAQGEGDLQWTQEMNATLNLKAARKAAEKARRDEADRIAEEERLRLEIDLPLEDKLAPQPLVVQPKPKKIRGARKTNVHTKKIKTKKKVKHHGVNKVIHKGKKAFGL